MSDRVTAAVVGCGSIGLYAGAAISQLTRLTVAFCARTPFDCIVVDEPAGRFLGQGDILTAPDQAGPVDLVLLATKAQDTAGAQPWLEALCADRTPVLVLQNGIEHEERVRPLAPGRPIIPSIIWYGAEHIAPGQARLTMAGDVTVPDTDDGRYVADLLSCPRLRFRVSPQFEVDLWTKFVVNVVSNSLTTILDVPVNRLPRIPEALLLMDRLVEECRRIASATGVELPEDLAIALADRFNSFDDEVRASTQVDRASGRPFEHDAIIGAAVRLGTSCGVSCETAALIHSILRAISQSLAARPARA